ncbi:hypothetical protein HDU97_000754 [Phlyctochytrium planicorne]|nr:hypothetical protein HDU97_000754 [Phlyctochytrium planicorne]
MDRVQKHCPFVHVVAVAVQGDPRERVLAILEEMCDGGGEEVREEKEVKARRREVERGESFWGDLDDREEANTMVRGAVEVHVVRNGGDDVESSLTAEGMYRLVERLDQIPWTATTSELDDRAARQNMERQSRRQPSPAGEHFAIMNDAAPRVSTRSVIAVVGRRGVKGLKGMGSSKKPSYNMPSSDEHPIPELLMRSRQSLVPTSPLSSSSAITYPSLAPPFPMPSSSASSTTTSSTGTSTAITLENPFADLQSISTSANSTNNNLASTDEGDFMDPFTDFASIPSAPTTAPHVRTRRLISDEREDEADLLGLEAGVHEMTREEAMDQMALEAADEEFARKLQEEEDALAMREYQLAQQQQQQVQAQQQAPQRVPGMAPPSKRLGVYGKDLASPNPSSSSNAAAGTAATPSSASIISAAPSTAPTTATTTSTIPQNPAVTAGSVVGGQQQQQPMFIQAVPTQNGGLYIPPGGTIGYYVPSPPPFINQNNGVTVIQAGGMGGMGPGVVGPGVGMGGGRIGGRWGRRW